MINQASPDFSEKVIEYFQDIYDRNWYTEGKYTKLVIDKFSRESNIENVLPVPNGTLGIFLAILALDLPPKSKIIVPTFTFYGSITPILFAGHIPVLADCCPSTYQMTVENIKEVYTSDVKAVMTIPIYGQSANLDEIHDFVREEKLFWIEDCAQGVGVSWNGKHVGSYGDVAIFSTFSDKSFASGEGGLIASNSDQIFRNITLIRNQGRMNSGTFSHESLGMNFRITDIQAALMYEQFMRWKEIRTQRQTTWMNWFNNISDCKQLQSQQILFLSESVPFRFAFISDNQKSDMNIIESFGMATRGCFMPMHLQPKLLKYSDISLPNSEKIWKQGICLPVHHEVTLDIIKEITKGLNYEISYL